MKSPKWKQLQDYVAEQLKEIDPYARSTKGSGNQGELGDVNNSVEMNIECKQSDKIKNITIKEEWWNHVCEEIPLHSKRIPILITENCEGKRKATLDLDDFLTLYKELWRLRNDK